MLGLGRLRQPDPIDNVFHRWREARGLRGVAPARREGAVAVDSCSGMGVLMWSSAVSNRFLGSRVRSTQFGLVGYARPDG
jgi:hypothetical protein